MLVNTKGFWFVVLTIVVWYDVLAHEYNSRVHVGNPVHMNKQRLHNIRESATSTLVRYIRWKGVWHWHWSSSNSLMREKDKLLFNLFHNYRLPTHLIISARDDLSIRYFSRGYS